MSILRYKKHHLDFLKKNCKLPGKELTEKFNILFSENQTESKIKQACLRRGWRSGIENKFKKGHIPHHKGTKGVVKASKTSFKKGRIPHNKKPIGSERVSGQSGYTLVKVSEKSEWKLKQIIVWEKYYNRKVPDGHVIRFLDGNKLNFAIDNLILMHLKTHMYLMKTDYRDLGIEIRHSAIKLAELVVKLKSIDKK